MIDPAEAMIGSEAFSALDQQARTTGVKLHIFYCGPGRVTLHSMRAVTSGRQAGSVILVKVTEMAGEFGVSIAVKPSAADFPEGDKAGWPLTARLRDWYRRHGFEDDPEDSRRMLWEPPSPMTATDGVGS